MNKLNLICSFLIALSLTTWGQKNKRLTFDIDDFNRKTSVAEWLYMYDAIAWWTSDSVMVQDTAELNRLGNEWFCYQTPEKNWHAVYGKYNENKFDIVFHFFVDTTSKVSRIYESVDTIILNSYSRALITANMKIKSIKDSNNIKFNQYIKRNNDKTFSVWILPAFQTNNYAVYGGEFIYIIDWTGTKILKDESYYQGQFRAFKVGEPREIWLNYRELDKPTLGSIFFVWYYKKYFTNIRIDNKDYVTTTFKNDDGSYSWINVEKDQKEIKK